MDLKAIQKPLKQRYREDGDAARITITAKASTFDNPTKCSVDLGRKQDELLKAYAHEGVGGGGGACSGDLLLGALAACAQITCQMVATAMQIETNDIAVTVTGLMDLRGTLGISRDVPVGFESIDLDFKVDAPNATTEQLQLLAEKTEIYCVVLQTLKQQPKMRSTLNGLPTISRLSEPTAQT
jgi:uncharacterized OsmC-like protein